MKGRYPHLTILTCMALTFWSGHFVWAQDPIDSLLQELRGSQSVEQQIELNLLLAKEWIIRSPDSSLPYAQRAYNLSERQNNPELKIEALNIQGNILQRQSKAEAALELYQQAIAEAENLNYKKGLAKLYNNVALIHTERGDYPKALSGFTEATRYEEEIDNQEGIAQGLNNIGVVFYYQGEYDKAMDYFLQSVKVHEAMGNKLSAKQGYNNIGAINEALGRHLEALEFYQRSLDIAIELEDRAEIGHSYNNIAGAYSSMANWTEAERYFQKALETNQANADDYSLALNYLNLADMYQKSGQAKKSMPLFQKASDLVVANSFKTLAFDLYNKMAVFYSEQGDYEKAYEYRGLYEQYKDSVYDEAKAKAIAETEALYETEKKDREAAEAKAALVQEQLKTERQNLWLSVLIAGVILVLLISVSVIRQLRAKRRQLETEAALQEERARAEGRKRLDEERSRISRDLHDHIGAQLTIISSQIDNLAFREADENRKAKFESISDHTRDTMAQLRETIWAMNNDEISLSMLQAKLQDFMRRSEQEGRLLRVLNLCSQDLVLGPSQTINLFRICQEAVQNALKYAGFSLLEIRFDCRDRKLEISIEDDGCGIPEDAAQRGYGIQNMEARMKQMNGSFEIESVIDAGTRIILLLPLNTPIAV